MKPRRLLSANLSPAAGKGRRKSFNKRTNRSVAYAAESYLSYVGDFRKLQVWRKAHELALTCHRVAARMRGPGTAPLRNQLLRSAISIPANIVEGSAKSSDREFARYVRIAIGSSSELEYHAILGNDIGSISQKDFDLLIGQLTDVRKMLSGLLARLLQDRLTGARGRTQATD